DFLLRECERSYPFKYLSIVRRSTFKSRANWLLLIFILELSISKFNFGKSSSPLISISVLISICICIIFTPKILCITNHLLYILIQSFMYIVRVSFIPLPATRDTCSLQPSDTVHYTLVPFNFIKDIISSSTVVWSQPSTYVSLLTQSCSIQSIFNFLLLMPFGVYLRYFFNRRRYWKKAFGLGFILSLFYEVTQLTGIYGIYNCPYRIFDVDDLFL